MRSDNLKLQNYQKCFLPCEFWLNNYFTEQLLMHFDDYNKLKNRVATKRKFLSKIDHFYQSQKHLRSCIRDT